MVELNININVDKNTVGLGNVDNTSDVNKPVSTLQQDAIDQMATIIAGVIDAGDLDTLNAAKQYTDDEITNLDGSIRNDLGVAIDLKQDELGFTPEDIVNKATDFSTLNDTLYPSVAATNSRINELVAAAIASAGANYLTKNGLTGLTGNWNAGLFSITANSVILGSAANTIAGGATSGGGFTLSSTTNATKGKLLFGTSAYDEVNNRLGIGTNAPLHSIHARLDQSGVTGIAVQNATSTGIARFLVLGSSRSIGFGVYGSAATPYGSVAGNDCYIYGDGNNFVIMAEGASSTIKFSAGPSTLEIARVNSGGFSIGMAGIATSARLHIGAQTSAINTSPIKLNEFTGTLPAAEKGAFDFHNLDLKFTKNAVRGTVLVSTAVTTEVIVSDTTLTITHEGVTYKLLARA